MRIIIFISLLLPNLLFAKKDALDLFPKGMTIESIRSVDKKLQPVGILMNTKKIFKRVKEYRADVDTLSSRMKKNHKKKLKGYQKNGLDLIEKFNNLNSKRLKQVNTDLLFIKQSNKILKELNPKIDYFSEAIEMNQRLEKILNKEFKTLSEMKK